MWIDYPHFYFKSKFCKNGTWKFMFCGKLLYMHQCDGSVKEQHSCMCTSCCFITREGKIRDFFKIFDKIITVNVTNTRHKRENTRNAWIYCWDVVFHVAFSFCVLGVVIIILYCLSFISFKLVATIMSIKYVRKFENHGRKVTFCCILSCLLLTDHSLLIL